MPHATRTEISLEPSRGAKNSSKQQIPKQFRGLQRLYDESTSLYDSSSLSASLETMLRPGSRSAINKVVSLGLGSLLEKSRDQPRRFKQLAIFIAIGDFLRRSSPLVGGVPSLELYAQDPTFTKADEAFLQSLGVQILRTASASDLGEAREVIDKNTLVYSPFLTMNAYELLLELGSVDLLIGDDFNSLLRKWEKHTAEHKQVAQIAKSHISQYQRRAVAGSGFWAEDDHAFPMALYSKKSDPRQKSSGSLASTVEDKAQREITRLSARLAKAKL